MCIPVQLGGIESREYERGPQPVVMSVVQQRRGWDTAWSSDTGEKGAGTRMRLSVCYGTRTRSEQQVPRPL